MSKLPVPILYPAEQGALCAFGGAIANTQLFQLQTAEHMMVLRPVLVGAHVYVVAVNTFGFAEQHRHSMVARRNGDPTRWSPIEGLLFEPHALHRYFRTAFDRVIEDTSVVALSACHTVVLGYSATTPSPDGACARQVAHSYFPPGDYVPTNLVLDTSAERTLTAVSGTVRNGCEVTLACGKCSVRCWIVIIGSRVVVTVLKPKGVMAELLTGDAHSGPPECMELLTLLREPELLFRMCDSSGFHVDSIETYLDRCEKPIGGFVRPRKPALSTEGDPPVATKPERGGQLAATFR